MSRSNKPPAGSPSLHQQSVSWTVDLESGTYTAKNTEMTQRDRQMVERARQRQAVESRDGKLTTVHPEEYGPGYSFLYGAETWEPAAYIGFDPLTRTEAEIDWSVCSNRMYLDSFFPSCWANPATLGINFTSWSTISCIPDDPPDEDSFALTGGVTGIYINWDFGSNSQATYAYQDVSIEAAGGGGYGWVYQYQYGEASYLLSGHEFSSPVYPRPSRCSRPGGSTGGGDDGDDGDPDDPGPSDPPGGGSRTCVPVYDGSNGDYLGDCCGSSVEEILTCAWGML